MGMMVASLRIKTNPPIGRSVVSVLAHVALLSFSLLAAFVLAYNFSRTEQWFFPQFMMALPVFLLVKYLVFTLTHQYQRSWRYVGYSDVSSIVLACSAAAGVVYGLLLLFRAGTGASALGRIGDFPMSVLWIDLILSVALVIGARSIIRYYFQQGRSAGARGVRTLMIGAGDAGETLLREIRRMPLAPYDIVGILDDDTKKLGTRIHGIEVISSVDTVKMQCNLLDVEQVLIAIPSASRTRIREIIELCEGANVDFRIVPGLSELIEGSVTIESQVRRVKVEDLLHRAPVVLDHSAISKFVTGKTVLVTGGGGSIGSELCRQICQFQPRRVVVVELCENNLFDIERELRASQHSIELTPYLGDICDARRMRSIFESHRPEIVCHAAAHKHVPMLEAHPGEGLKNNIVGTRMLADLAVDFGVHKFVYISTDKAVNPTSIMGCTKRIAEMYVQGLSDRTKTQFITVRFGNVLASRGSVVPIFQEQIAKGGPITVTHPDITRYFMTIPEAAQLVLQAGAIGKGGEIFLLEMGEPIKIVDLAKNLITLSGLTPGQDIAITFTGLRPGEKLYEELYIEGEGLGPTVHPHIRVWQKREENWEALLDAIDNIVALADEAELVRIKAKLVEIVPEYSTSAAEDPAGINIE
ncbi:MAG: polysaccharide biosynthesis protein [Planctomycetes bacterium]|nr:polysaccharide biosynthesis protein [Planctomycetota bacterium]